MAAATAARNNPAMPAFLEAKLKKEYGGGKAGDRAVYGTLNKIGAMRGSKETARGREMEAKHDRKQQRKRDSKR